MAPLASTTTPDTPVPAIPNATPAREPLIGSTLKSLVLLAGIDLSSQHQTLIESTTSYLVCASQTALAACR